MPPTTPEALIAYVLTVDRGAMAYLVPITILFSIGFTALLGRRRRLLEIIAIFLLILMGLSLLLVLLFNGVLDRPVVRLEIIRA